jgi:hypothetical protein
MMYVPMSLSQGSSYLFTGSWTQSAGDLQEDEPRGFALALIWDFVELESGADQVQGCEVRIHSAPLQESSLHKQRGDCVLEDVQITSAEGP